jgi:replicative superfamily II helicase
MPARRVIIVGIHRGISEVDSLDILQMGGRSGRVGIDDKGDAHVLIRDKFNEKDLIK